MTEYLPVVDDAGSVLGRAPRQECHGGSHLLHPVVHLHVFSSKGELYLQRRSWEKDLLPGYWDTAVGGHVSYGETIPEALRREVAEEIGVNVDVNPNVNFNPNFNFNPNVNFNVDVNTNLDTGHAMAEHWETYRFDNPRESELIHVFRTTYDGPFHWNDGEVIDGRFWSPDELRQAIGKGIFTPNLEQELLRFVL